jgi:ATP diphosphatase
VEAAEAVAEEAQELASSGEAAAAFDEMGDLLFAVVSLARHMKVNPEDALRVAGQRFRKRFAGTEAALRSEGKSFRDIDDAEMAARWRESGGEEGS